MTAYVLHLSTLILRYCIGGHSLCLVTVSSAFVQLHLVLLRASRLSTTNRFRVPSDSHISCGSSLWISLAMIPRSSTDSEFFFSWSVISVADFRRSDVRRNSIGSYYYWGFKIHAQSLVQCSNTSWFSTLMILFFWWIIFQWFHAYKSCQICVQVDSPRHFKWEAM